MSTYHVHTTSSAPESSKPALRELEQRFGFVPNIAGVMAESAVLLDTFVAVFLKVHAGHFSEAQIQTLLLTNAVTNSSGWPVAFHSELARRAGVAPRDIAAIRERRAPEDPQLAALSVLTRTLIEQRGHLAAQDLIAFRDAGFSKELALEVLTVIAASCMTNYTANFTNPPLEAQFHDQVWSV